MRKSKVSRELDELLKSGGWLNFTITDVKNAYMRMPGCPHQTDKAAWQFVHRNIIRMQTMGLVGRIEGDSKDKARYTWIGENVAQDHAQASVASYGGASDDTTINCLKVKLQQYKVEMLSAIGEAEEYDALCTELPHMRNTVQSLYNEARDHCSKMLGRVRALESILSKQFQLQQSA